jgi:hypothetical protein
MKISFLFLVILFAISSCRPTSDSKVDIQENQTFEPVENFGQRVQQYYPVRLKADLSHLSEKEKQMISIFIEAAGIMDEIFWMEAFGDKEKLLQGIEDADARKYAMINYGPWDRLDNNQPFLIGFNGKPDGANFYHSDITKEEFESVDIPDKTSLYTLINRDETGKLNALWYHDAYKDKYTRVSELLKKAAQLAEDEGLRNYLNARAEAFLSSNYQNSDLLWLDMKNNNIDLVIGPIESYEDNFMGIKAAHEAFVLIKDREWSRRLEHFAAFLPELQRGLPVDEKYKAETPGTDADLGAYEVIYYAGDANAGTKTIAINLPNDEEVQLKKGTRRLQLKNAMKAKYDNILAPISDVLIAEDQRKHIKFDAFFSNVMFHEVAHGLGIKNVVSGSGTVNKALREHHSAIEENKADILGLYLIDFLHTKKEISGDMMDYYVTFLAGIFRSVRFGAASAHGKANMITFNYFREKNAFTRDNTTGTYKVNEENMRIAIRDLANNILTIQGDGDYDKAATLLNEKGIIPHQLQTDLDRLKAGNIPVDIVFEQGKIILGL